MKPCRAAHPLEWRIGRAGVLAVVLAVSARGARPAAPVSLSEGSQIFSRHCAQCHGDQGQGISAIATIAGPSLKAEHQPGRVLAAVEEGPSHMPQFEYVLSESQMHAVSEFVAGKLAVIPMGEGDLAHGGELFRAYCASCHRTAVRGGALGYVGVNAPSLTGKSAPLIAGAIRWGPGPMPSFPSSVLDDRQLDSIVDYIQYAQQPLNPGGAPLNWYGPVAEGFAAWVGLLGLIFLVSWIEKGGKG